MIALQGKTIKRVRNDKSFEIHITGLYALQNKLELQNNYQNRFIVLQPPVTCIITAKMTFGHSLHWLQGYISYSLSCSFMSPSDISPNVSLFSFMSLKMAASCSL